MIFTPEILDELNKQHGSRTPEVLARLLEEDQKTWPQGLPSGTLDESDWA